MFKTSLLQKKQRYFLKAKETLCHFKIEFFLFVLMGFPVKIPDCIYMYPQTNYLCS